MCVIEQGSIGAGSHLWSHYTLHKTTRQAFLPQTTYYNAQQVHKKLCLRSFYLDVFIVNGRLYQSNNLEFDDYLSESLESSRSRQCTLKVYPLSPWGPVGAWGLLLQESPPFSPQSHNKPRRASLLAQRDCCVLREIRPDRR